jgi:hypothetical protein
VTDQYPYSNGREAIDWRCDVYPIPSSSCEPGQVDAYIGEMQTCLALCSPGEAYLGNPNPQHPHGVSPHDCTATEHCVYLWRFQVDATGAVVATTRSESVGVCIDHAKLEYDSDNDQVPDTPWPTCESQPVHRTSESNVPDATMMGCVSLTTAGL